MADPVTATIMLGLSAVRAGAAIGQWWETRQQRRPIPNPASSDASSQNEESRASGSEWFYRESDKLFLVLATLGQRLLALDVINRDALEQARLAVRQAHKMTDSKTDDLGKVFEELDVTLQYTVACAVVFCAACFPMHMYRGFGCGVLDDKSWADLQDDSWVFRDLDKALAYLKSVPHEWKLLRKSPGRIGQTEPDDSERPKKEQKVNMKWANELVKQMEKRGFPQPLPPNDNICISTWEVPFATWGGTSIYDTHGHNLAACVAWQQDPGRYLYAWTVGERLDLRVGHALDLSEKHLAELALWLEGLAGMTHKCLYDTNLDYTRLKLSSSLKKLLQKATGNEYGQLGLASAIVRDPRYSGSAALPPPTTFAAAEPQRQMIVEHAKYDMASVNVAAPLPTVTTIMPISPTQSLLVSPMTGASPHSQCSSPVSQVRPPILRKPMPVGATVITPPVSPAPVSPAPVSPSNFYPNSVSPVSISPTPLSSTAAPPPPYSYPPAVTPVPPAGLYAPPPPSAMSWPPAMAWPPAQAQLNYVPQNASQLPLVAGEVLDVVGQPDVYGWLMAAKRDGSGGRGLVHVTYVRQYPVSGA